MIETMFTLLHISKQLTVTSSQQMFSVNDRVRIKPYLYRCRKNALIH